MVLVIGLLFREVVEHLLRAGDKVIDFDKHFLVLLLGCLEFLLETSIVLMMERVKNFHLESP